MNSILTKLNNGGCFLTKKMPALVFYKRYMFTENGSKDASKMLTIQQGKDGFVAHKVTC